MVTPRDLKFTNWEEVALDLKDLLNGYESKGSWSLAQTALHLNDWLSFPMDGFPKLPLLMRPIFGLIRKFRGNAMLQTILANGFHYGTPTMPATVHQNPTASDAEAVEQLLHTMHRFRDYEGAIHPSPLFGSMDYDTAEQLQLVHFTHHLALLWPTEA